MLILIQIIIKILEIVHILNRQLLKIKKNVAPKMKKKNNAIKKSEKNDVQ